MNALVMGNLSIYNEILNKVNKELENILAEEREISVLKEYGIYNIYFGNKLNEDFSSQTQRELNDLKKTLGHLGHIAGKLILKLLKYGARQSVILIVKAAKQMYKFGKSHQEVGKYIVGSLMFLLLGYFGNDFIDRYNQKPLIPDSTIEHKEINGEDSLIINDKKSDETVVIQQPDKDKAPVIKKTKKNKESVVNAVKDHSPIMMLKPGEKAPEEYNISNEMFHALAEVEHFVPRIYDTANPNKKVTLKQLRSGQGDITCCFGHKLTLKERRTWNPNKRFTYEEGLEIYKRDLQAHINICNNKLKDLPYYDKVRFSQGFFDMMVSMEFNMGAGSMFGNATRPTSEFWRRLMGCRLDTKHGALNKNDLEWALAKVNTQNTGGKRMGGLKTRRRAEYFIGKQVGNKVNPDLYYLKSKDVD